MVLILARRIRERAKVLEEDDMDRFYKFICMGKSLIEYAAQGDIGNFARLVDESEERDLMFWHVTKALKAAVKNKHADVTRYIVDEPLFVSLNHEAFQKMLHLFLFCCQEADMHPTEKERTKAHSQNRELLSILAKGKGRDGIDELDNVSSATPLMVACEMLNDIEIVKILCEAGADINSVNNDNKMPLSLVKERIDKKLQQGETSSEELSKLKLIYDYLE